MRSALTTFAAGTEVTLRLGARRQLLRQGKDELGTCGTATHASDGISGTNHQFVIVGCGRKESTTVTLVPVSVREARWRAAELSMRKQPDDCARPMDFASLVPWMRYKVSPKIKSDRAQRIAHAARHSPGQARITFAHLCGGIPIGPGFLAAHRFSARPIEALTPN